MSILNVAISELEMNLKVAEKFMNGHERIYQSFVSK